MNKKLLIASIIVLFLGAAVFGAYKTVFAKQNEVQVNSQAMVGTTTEPMVVREQLAAGYGTGNQYGMTNGECDGSMTQAGQQLQAGSGFGAQNGQGMQANQGAGQQLGQGGPNNMGKGQQFGRGNGTCVDGAICSQNQVQQQLQDGTCTNLGIGTQMRNGRSN